MAKAKKESTAKSGAAGAAKKGPAKAPPAKGLGSVVDTNLAAQSAARMLAAGISAKPTASDTAAEPQQESAMFKQLKGGLAKGAGQAMNSLLDKHGGPTQKKTPSFGFGQQIGRNQTFGADVNRTGVPRRTGGG
jgi:hypothetical protein